MIRLAIDFRDLSQTGWGVMFGPSVESTVRQALQPLLELRRSQAGDLYRELTYNPGDSVSNFLRRHYADLGFLDPHKMPYYLLVVGSPGEIPFQFTAQLSTFYGVGRLDLPDPDSYARYAQNVVERAAGRSFSEPALAFFAPRHPGDAHTERMLDYFLGPLADGLERQGRWDVQRFFGPQAGKDTLRSLLAGPQPPALLIAGGQGLAYSPGSPPQVDCQGALVTGEWKGMGQPAPGEALFAAADLPDVLAGGGSLPAGRVCVFYSAFSAGTDRGVENPVLAQMQPRLANLAEAPFTSRLSQRLLSLPGGPALAFIGLVGPGWSYAHRWERPGVRPALFQDVINRLGQGLPLGAALEPVNLRYAELASQLAQMLSYADYKPVSDEDLIPVWTALQDAHALTILGDPAVSLVIASYETLVSQKPVEASKGGPVLEPAADLRLELKQGMVALPALLYPYLEAAQHPLFRLRVSNHRDQARGLLRLSAWIGRDPGGPSGDGQEIELEAGPLEQVDAPLLPPLPGLPPDDPKPGPLMFFLKAVEIPSGRTLLEQSVELRLIDPQKFPLAVREVREVDKTPWHDFTRFLGLYITPDDPAVRRLAADQLPRYVPGLRLAERSADRPAVPPEAAGGLAAGIFNLVRASLAVEPKSGAIDQRLSDQIVLKQVILPAQALELGRANSLQAALLFASLAEAAGLEAALVLLPGRALAAWTAGPPPDPAGAAGPAAKGASASPESGWQYLLLDEDLPFETNLEVARKTVYRYQYSRQPAGAFPNFRLEGVGAMRAAGVRPLSSASPR